MAAEGNNEFDIELIKSAIGWFFSGLAAICSIVATALFGRMYRQHNTMHEWYISNTDPEKTKLKDQLIQSEQASLKKYHDDVAYLKHKFTDIQIAMGPFLKRISEEEISIVEQMKIMNEKLEHMHQPVLQPVKRSRKKI